MSDLEISRLKDVLRYDSNGSLVWLPREGSKTFNSRFAGKVAGNVNCQGYLQVQIDGKNYLAHRLVWFLHKGEWPEIVDHLNGNRTDNRFENLTSVSSLHNGRNQCRGLANKGISELPSGSFRVVVSDRHVGVYKTLEEATIARNAVYVWGGFSERHRED